MSPKVRISSSRGAPYRLDQRAATFELAKDVSALANEEGGLIVIGFRTRKEEVSRQDIVHASRPFSREHFDLDQARSVIRSRVFPEIEDLTLSWRGENERGMALIDVPRQADERKPFIIIEPIDEGGETPGYLIGLARRRGAHAEPMRAHDLHRLLRDGSGISIRLEAIEASIQRIEHVAPHEDVVEPEAAIAERVNEALDED